MEFYEVVGKRKTIRRFSDRPVPEEAVKKILQAGLMAPTNDHMRQWDFVLLKDLKTREEMVIADNVEDITDPAELARYSRFKDDNTREMYIDANKLQKSMILTAPEVLIVCYKAGKPIKEITQVFEMNYIASIWCCIENILLAMAAEDIYGVTHIPEKPDNIRHILGIPDGYGIAVVIPFGYPSADAKRCKQNSIDLESRLHINKW